MGLKPCQFHQTHTLRATDYSSMNMYDASSVVKVLESINTNWLSDGFRNTHTRLKLNVFGTNILFLNHNLVTVKIECWLTVGLGQNY